MTDHYACLECGFVYPFGSCPYPLEQHLNEVKERKDEEAHFFSGRPMGGSHTVPAFHGYIIYRVCPKCRRKVQVEVIPDKP